MIVRPEVLDDAGAIRAVHAAAFADQAPVGGVAGEVGLVDALRAAGDLIGPLSLVAEVDGAVVGHVATSRARPDGLVGVGPLGVLPAHQRTGVGSALMHSVIGAADALSYAGLVLLGDPDYYCRFGFERAGVHGLVPEVDEWPREAFLVRPLSSWSDAYPQGTVFHYAPAFLAL